MTVLKQVESLQPAQKPGNDSQKNVKKSNVVNLSRYVLNEDEIKVFKYGLNFAVAPGKILAKELMCSVEDAVTDLLENNAEEAR